MSILDIFQPSFWRFCRNYYRAKRSITRY